MIHEYGNERLNIRDHLPVVAMRETVIFPYMVYPMIVGRQFSLEALQQAMIGDKLILLLAQKRKEVEQPAATDLYRVGTVARVLQVMKLATGTMKVVVEGICRAKVRRLTDTDRYWIGHLEIMEPTDKEPSPRVAALQRTVTKLFSDYVALNRRLPDEVVGYATSVEEADKLTDIVAAHLQISLAERQKLLEIVPIHQRLERLAKVLSSEIEVLKLEQEIDSGVRESLTRSQREFYLQHQLKVIKEELGQADDGVDVEEYEEKILKVNLSEEAREKAIDEVSRLAKMHSYSAEAAVIRAYLDWLLGLPWGEVTKDRRDFKRVEAILDAEHYGLEKAKRRITEHLAVLKLAGNVKGPILCLVGPPGVGKTSLGRSIANAMDRKFARMSLGGVKDEAEIRGHRRTYVGSLPGRIVQMLKKVGSSNPVFLLDEVDKIGVSFQGDPAAALLEVLDPEQNATFQDHYLECEFDLSQILFITTANTMAGIPPALLDRMEIIELPGYLEYEKIGIAQGFLIPKQKMECGLIDKRINLAKSVLQALIRDYTRESGVRELERKIGAIFRQLAQKVARGGRQKSFTITKSDLPKYLGAPRYHEMSIGATVVGKSLGLAWTQVGGEILPIEVLLTPGKGKLTLTGKLGEVMRESAQTALTLIKFHAKQIKIDLGVFRDNDIHLHVPEGAVPKDGPSAGTAILVALTSALTGKLPAKSQAYSGEITLTGEVLPVGGLNAKLIAAARAHIGKVLVPARNQAEIEELPKELLEKLEIVYVKQAREVLKLAFGL
ncbi:MAG: endopeptidase La [bacterium]